MGVVYKALDRELGAEVALKTLPRPDRFEAHALKQEFRALQDVHHENLVELFDLVVDQEDSFFSMELLEGIPFVARFQEGAIGWEGGPGSPLALLCEAGAQLMDGLDALHRAGVVHRDVKPSNVILTAQGRVVLMDFGLAGFLDRGGRAAGEDFFSGSIAYAAPEQLSTTRVGPEADLYSAGTVLYEAITGALPFEGDPERIASDKWTRDPPSLHARSPTLPLQIADLVRSLLSRDPTKRPTARAARSALEAFAPRRRARPASLHSARSPFAEIEAFVGRAREMESLRGWLVEMEAGSSPFVALVHGESGVGKSALLQKFCDAIGTEQRTVVLTGRCHPNEAVPYKALDAVMDRLVALLTEREVSNPDWLDLSNAGALLRLFPAMAQAPWKQETTEVEIGAGAAEIRQQGIDALRSLLTKMAGSERVVIWIDDIQWSDKDSAFLLRELLEGLQGARLLLMLSYRTNEGSRSPLLGEIAGAANAGTVRRRDLALAPMLPADARHLLDTALGETSLDGEDLETLLDQAQGAPYLLWEVAQYHRETGLARELSAESGNLDDILGHRLRRFPDEARAMLETISVAGGPIDRSAMFLATGGGQKAPSVFSALCKAKLLRRAPGAETTVQIFHDRIRDVLLRDLDAAKQKAIHGHLASALETTGCSDVGLLAVHHAGAGQRDRSASYARQAADFAMRSLAFERGAQFYKMALEQGAPLVSRQEAELTALLGNAHAAAGRTTAAADCLVSAAGMAPPGQALRHRQLAAELLIGAGHLTRGRQVLGSALESVGLRLPTRGATSIASAIYLRARLRARGLHFVPTPAERVPPEILNRIDVCWTVAGSLGFFDAVSAFGFQTRHMLLALDAGEVSRIARALATELVYLDTTGRDRARVKELQPLLDHLETQLTGADERAYLLLASGFRHLHAGRFQISLTDLGKAEKLYGSLRAARWERNMCRTHRVFALTLSGRIAEAARAEAELSPQLLAEDDVSAASNLGLITGYASELFADRPDRALERVERALRPWSPTLPLSFDFLAVMARIRIFLYSSAPKAAMSTLESAWNRLKPIHAYQSERLMLNWLRGLVALSAAAPKSSQIARVAAEQIDRERMPWSNGLASILRAGISLASGERASSLEHIERAIRQFQLVNLPLDAAAAGRWRGVLLGGSTGAEAIQLADTDLQQQGVTNPERWTSLHAPVALSNSLFRA